MRLYCRVDWVCTFICSRLSIRILTADRIRLVGRIGIQWRGAAFAKKKKEGCVAAVAVVVISIYKIVIMTATAMMIWTQFFGQQSMLTVEHPDAHG